MGRVMKFKKRFHRVTGLLFRGGILPPRLLRAAAAASLTAWANASWISTKSSSSSSAGPWSISVMSSTTASVGSSWTASTISVNCWISWSRRSRISVGVSLPASSSRSAYCVWNASQSSLDLVKRRRELFPGLRVFRVRRLLQLFFQLRGQVRHFILGPGRVGTLLLQRLE